MSNEDVDVRGKIFAILSSNMKDKEARHIILALNDLSDDDFDELVSLMQEWKAYR